MALPEAELRRIPDMETLERVVRGCTRCSLRSGCRGVVFGDGNPRARVMLIGEGPGADEDRLGRPFVGRAGQLLDRILAACGFDRQRHVYIANVVKCRPPGNRTPTPEERAACLPNLRAQMRLVNPVIVVLMGATALQALIDPAARISRLRGQWIHRDGIWYMPTYHPAALLRNPSLKRESWHDFKLVIDRYRELVDAQHTAPHYPARRPVDQGPVRGHDAPASRPADEPIASRADPPPPPPEEPVQLALAVEPRGAGDAAGFAVEGFGREGFGAGALGSGDAAGGGRGWP